MKKGLILSIAALCVATCGVTNVTYGATASAPKVEKVVKLKDVKVSSLDELFPLLKKDNQSVVMEAGTYRITEADAKAGKYTTTSNVEGEDKINPVIFLIEGSNNIFDFTGVTIEIESGVANSFEGPHISFLEMQILGNDNVVKNLKLEDKGEVDDFPKYGWMSVVMDGSHNRLEGVEIITIGSKPYGYGEIFGKGAGSVIQHAKHAACLIRGNYNQLKDCKIYNRAYGHFVFMQGAENVTIDGCYIEGEMVSTDSILEEKGSGSAADKVNFKTVFGYDVPKGYTLSTGEDGIRTYPEGTTMVDGVRYTKRATGGKIVVKNCTVKHARGGVALTLGKGTRHVENCTLIGCQEGYSTNSGGRIVNCKADAEFGPAFWVPYKHLTGITADITIIPYEGTKYVGNGSGHMAFIQGMTHDITFKKGEGLEITEGLSIDIGGDYNTIGQREVINNHPASNNTITNETGYPIKIGSDTSYNTIITNGDYSGNDSDNTIVAN
ncbi:MAG: right-handed parallel beta-helix repeat-containing protein [Rikenellaceae bacterium]